MGWSRATLMVLAGLATGGLTGCDGGPLRPLTPATAHTPTTAMRTPPTALRTALDELAKADGLPGLTPGAMAGDGPPMPVAGGPSGGARPGGGGGIGGGIGGGGGFGGGAAGVGGGIGGIGSQPGFGGPPMPGRGVVRGSPRYEAGKPSADGRGGYDSLHQEQYRHYSDNSFKPVATEPVTTFSADVNTAAYSNVRRFLRDGRLPPPDAVRTAELLNSFDYGYPAPKTGEPVAFALAAMPCPWQPKHQLVRIALKAKQIDPAEMPPRNLVFLIDTSGSMQSPTRLPLVQRSLGLLIDQLSPRDSVTVVTYAGSAGLKLPPTRGDQKARIRSVVDGLSAGGGTNGAGGITLAYEQARANFIEGGCNRVILCTDGDFNVGVTGEGELVRLIERERAGNVFLTVLGYGMGNLKDATLEILARHGNGHYAYIDSDAEARQVFVEQGAALTAVAKDVKLQVEFNPAAVAGYRLLGYENRRLETQDFKDDNKDAGDLGSGHSVTALYEVVPAGQPVPVAGADPLKYQHDASVRNAARTGEWLTAKMRYKHPESAQSQEVQAVLTADLATRPADMDFRFAAAVAEFGGLLRAGADKGLLSFDRVLAGAEAGVGPDAGGKRREFAELAKQARRLAGSGQEEAVR